MNTILIIINCLESTVLTYHSAQPYAHLRVHTRRSLSKFSDHDNFEQLSTLHFLAFQTIKSNLSDVLGNFLPIAVVSGKYPPPSALILPNFLRHLFQANKQHSGPPPYT